MAGRSLNISLVATLTPLEKSLAAVGKMMADFATSIEKTDAKLAASIKSSVATMDSELAKVKASFDNMGEAGAKAGVKSGTTLKRQLRDATIEAQRAADAFGLMSPEFQKASQKAAELKDQIDDVNDKIKVSGGSSFEKLNNSFQMIKDGILNLDFEKMKIGMSGFKAGAADAFASATKGMSGFKIALAATGIGALVVAIGLLAANWDKVTQAIDGVTQAQKEHLEESKKQTIEADKKLKIVESSENIYKMQGKTEKDILNLKILATKQALMKHEIEMKSAADIAKVQIESAKRNHDILQGILTALSSPIILVLKAVDMLGGALGKNFGLVDKFNNLTNSVANMMFDPDEMQKKADEASKAAQEGLLDMQNKVAGYQLAIKAIDKKEVDDKKKLDEELYKTQKANFEKSLAENTKRLKANLDEQKRIKEDIQKQGFATTFDSKTQKIDLIVGELKAPKQLVLPPVKLGNIVIDPKEIEKTKTLVASINQSMQQAFQQTAVLIGDSIGKALSGGFSKADAFASALNIIASFAQQLGEAMIAVAASYISFQTQIAVNPFAALAAGIVLVAGASIIRAKASSLSEQKPMAKGGVVYGPTNALVGEYSGASNNPEVVAPLDKLQGILSRSMGGGGNVNVRGHISGNDLSLVAIKTNRDLGRITGRR